MSDKGKWIGGITAILGLLAAALVLLTRYQELKKSSAEADVAEQRRRAEVPEPQKQQPPPRPKPAEVGKPNSDASQVKPAPVVVPNPPGQTIALSRKIDGPDPRLEIQLVKIELEPGQKMRWNFTLWNRTGKEVQRWWISSDLCHAVDENGNRLDSISTAKNDSFSLPIGEKVNYWIDFQPPALGARVVTAHFKQFEFYQTLPSPISVSLGK